MQQITEQQILALAPNSTAAANGKKISQKGGFVRLERSEDDTFYMGECSGSGKSNYITSADFIEQAAPVFRCSCPSRQFPCKHSLALLYEILEKKQFAVREIPEDILKKREKKQAKVAKEQEEAEDGSQAAKKKASAAKSSKTAKTKKIKKQLEGLELTAKLIQDLMKTGLGTMGGTALNTYQQLAKQLGDYYLPGPQRLLNRLTLEIAKFQKDGKEEHYEIAVEILERMWFLVKKSKEYLTNKLEQKEVEQDDSILYEELGGVWKLKELEEIGRSKKNVNLMQLSFWNIYDETRKEYIDTGCWGDLDTGEIFMTYNYRPEKALKYVKEEDSTFGVAQVPVAAYYPGEGNLRVRWDNAQIREVTEEDLQKIRSFASSSLAAEIKAAKNLLKNALAAPMLIRLISFQKIGNTSQGLALETESKETILLGNHPDLEPTTDKLLLLPNSTFLQNQVLLGAFYYNASARRFQIQPLSIITNSKLIRLLY